MRLPRSIWADESGFVFSAELVLVATTVVIGLTVALVSLRNQVVQEVTDVGQSFGSLSQSYSYAGVCKFGVGFTDGSRYIDRVDFCQDVNQVPGTEPGGISVRAWPWGAPLCPPSGEVPGPREGEVFGGTSQRELVPPRPLVRVGVLELFQDYPVNLVRAEVIGEPALCRDLPLPASAASPPANPGTGEFTLTCQLAVWIDPEGYARFQQRLVQQLASVALRNGEWVAVIEDHPPTLVVSEFGLPSGSRYEEVFGIASEQWFRPGDWGTDVADLGRETVLLVHAGPAGARSTAWNWFHLPRGQSTLRRGLKVNVEFVGRDGRVIGQEVLSLNVGHSGSPPGLEVFDVFNRRDADFRTLRTLGALNQQATAAAVAAREAQAGRNPEDLLVVVSPYLMLDNAGDPPHSFARRLVLPLTRKFTAQQAQELHSIRATVVAAAAPM